MQKLQSGEISNQPSPQTLLINPDSTSNLNPLFPSKPTKSS